MNELLIGDATLAHALKSMKDHILCHDHRHLNLYLLHDNVYALARQLLLLQITLDHAITREGMGMEMEMAMVNVMVLMHMYREVGVISRNFWKCNA